MITISQHTLEKRGSDASPKWYPSTLYDNRIFGGQLKEWYNKNSDRGPMIIFPDGDEMYPAGSIFLLKMDDGEVEVRIVIPGDL